MATFTNIAAYQFASLSELKPLRARLLARSRQLGLKGTILLSTEGINLFIAGSAEGTDELLELLRELPGLGDLKAKYSLSDHQPFNRMLVRIKKEIIAFGVPGIDPVHNPAPRLAPATLKQWLDEGRPLTLLDTRNDYEVKLGTFRNASSLGIDHFRDFPAAVDKVSGEFKEQPLVLFCTGGIRCEKAGPYLQHRGFSNVFQLEGGILRYFEECGSAHYEGECFVFDQRVGVDPALRETDSTQCFQCQAPLTQAEQSDPRYVPGTSCPYCHVSSHEQEQAQLLSRHRALENLVRVLPGSIPGDNLRPLSVSQQHDGLTVLEFLGRVLPHTPPARWEVVISAGLLLDERHQPVAADSRVHGGNRLLHRTPMSVEPPVSGKVAFLHEDEAVVVVDKPAPLPLHPGGRFERNTLQSWMIQVFRPLRPRPAHRLDANTTGLVVFCKTRLFASKVQPQFAEGSVGKQYLVRVAGHPPQDAFVCALPIQEVPGELGTRGIAQEGGLPARTEFTVISRRPDGTALLMARPVTGRTNQIRVHLWSLGWPVCGDPTYLREGRVGSIQTLGLDDPPMCLHSWRIQFTHPITRERVSYEAPAPPWAREAAPVESACGR